MLEPALRQEPVNQSRPNQRTAEFVRGFFLSLEQGGIQASILHGWQENFENELSDVDFVVARESFGQIAELVHDHCKSTGWQLCQILRHETTAAYCVCSPTDDPACAVALDACSDYQRNGTVLLSADELLEDRLHLPWGGYHLSFATELRYRFAKAAAKNKNVNASATEFALYPQEIRRGCEAWLAKTWSVSIESWNTGDLAPALANLRERTNSFPSLMQPGAPGRIVSRILHPTGLIVITGHNHFGSTAARLEKVFGHLYFRRFRKVGKFRAALLKDLVASTLIVVPELAFPWSKLLPADCVHRLNPARDPDTQCRDLAKLLHERCRQRDN